MAPRLTRWLTPLAGRVAAVCLPALLSACAVLEAQAPGTPADALLARFGVPQQRVALGDGGERWVYSRQPQGRQVFHLLLNDQGQLQRIVQVLEVAHFQRLRVGHDTEASVRAYFGAPALVEHVANFDGDIWTYRILEFNTERQAHVFLDPHGVVQRVMFTDELRNDRDPWR